LVHLRPVVPAKADAERRPSQLILGCGAQLRITRDQGLLDALHEHVDLGCVVASQHDGEIDLERHGASVRDRCKVPQPRGMTS
jgi:hypothetical protein